MFFIVNLAGKEEAYIKVWRNSIVEIRQLELQSSTLQILAGAGMLAPLLFQIVNINLARQSLTNRLHISPQLF